METEHGHLARAKINLCLHVTGKRPDGYHLLDSLVVFPGIGDTIIVDPARTPSLTLLGPFALDLSAARDNLVMRAAALMPEVPAAILLTKNLPIASGMGGGSADAAATLCALAELGGVDLPAMDDIATLGADVPVCIASRPARMQGVGEVVTPIAALPGFWMVLANPRIAVRTPDVFGALAETANPPLPPLPDTFADAGALFDWLDGTRNDLEPPAIRLCPAIGDAKSALAAQPGCRLSRMTGSGATVFGLFEDEPAALAAADAVRVAQPDWWVAAAPV